MIKVNLLSPEKKDVAGGAADQSFAEEPKESKISALAGILAAVITIGTIGLLYFTQANTLEEKQNLLNDKKAKKATLKNVEETLAKLEQTKALLNQKVTLIGDLEKKKRSAVKMMDALSDALPDWVWLSSLSFTDNLLSLKGNAIHNNLIADFINNLKATNSFTNVRFGQSSRMKSKQAGFDVYQFDLSCIYVEKAPAQQGGKVK